MRPAQDRNVLTSTASEETAYSRNRLIRVFGACVAVLIADQLTKRLAVAELADGPTREVLGIRFSLFFNPGASFSMFADGSAGPILGVLALIISGVLIRAGLRATDTWSPWIYGVIAGGALGNFADRLLRAEDGFLSGTVVDFIDLGWWPVFNVADSALIGGVVALFLITFLNPDSTDLNQSDSNQELDNDDIATSDG